MKKIEVDPARVTDTASCLIELVKRLELDAAAFALIQTRDGALLAAERLEAASAVQELAEYFGGL